MAIISFWNDDKKASGQTLSLTAIATQMCIEHNMKVLMVDANFNDDTLARCFWNVNPNKSLIHVLNRGKIDIGSGAEGAVSAVASNKASPEVISSFTKIVFKNRLDVLPGLKTKEFNEYNNSLNYYVDLLEAANKYYDMVFVDLPKTLDNDTVEKIVEKSALIVYTMKPNLKQIDNFIKFKNESPLYKKRNIIPILSISDSNSRYNVKNTTRYIGEKKTISTVPYNTLFMESACEAQVPNMFLQLRLSKAAQDRNIQFLNDISNCGKSIIYKLQELQYKV